MYIHIGGEVTIPSHTISLIVSLETVLPSQTHISDFIRAEDEVNRLEYLSGDLPKSLVITERRTYVSPISVSTLLRRISLFLPEFG